MKGRRILHYEIREKLGQGGMGEVFLARDDRLDRDVALKFIPPSLRQSPEAHTRLLREAQAASRLSHPHIVAIHAIEKSDDGQDFIVMEYVRGRTLSDLIAANALSLEQALDLARQIADALAAAHETGVVHRDIKSSNILVTEHGHAKMLDFGLATFYGATQVTDAGSTMGTASYMSPEQTEGRPIDHRSDLFSFGVVLYEMIAGRRPFEGDNRNAVSYAICNQIQEPLARFKTGVPASVEQIVAKALRKDPTERYQSAADMRADLKVASRESDRTQLAPGTPAGGTPGYDAPPQQPPHSGYGPHTPSSPQPYGTPPATPSAPQPYGTPPRTPPGPQYGAPPQTPSAPQPYSGPPQAPPSPHGGYAPQTPSASMPPHAAPAAKGGNRALIIALIVVGAIAVAVLLIPRFTGRDSGGGRVSSVADVSPREDDRIMIAILPFENRGDADDEYFADGISDEITARLASVHDLGVIARTSVASYKGSNKPVQDIGRELGVDYVLEGTVRWQRSADGTSRVRVTPQLVRVADETQMWADVYDEPMTAVFQVQTNIAKSVVRELDVTLLTKEENAIESAPTDNMEAYDAYLRGMRLKNRYDSVEQMRIADQQFQTATELDPGFLMAWVRLSEVNADIVWFVLEPTEERVQRSRRAAEEAMRLAPESPYAKWAMGWFYYHAKTDFHNALRYLEPALAQLPNSAEAHGAVAYVYRRLGQWDDAIEHLTRASELSPKDGILWFSLGETYWMTRQFEAAHRYLDRARTVSPELSFPLLQAAVCYVSEGKLDKAEATARQLMENFPEDEWALIAAIVAYMQRDFDAFFDFAERSEEFPSNNDWYRPKSLWKGIVYFHLNREDEARREFAASRDHLLEKIAETPDDYRYHGALGIAYAGLGERDDALRSAERALELMPPTRDAYRAGSRYYELVMTYVLLGEDDKAIDILETMLSIPSEMTVERLRLEPFFDPLRDHPRFRALAGNS